MRGICIAIATATSGHVAAVKRSEDTIAKVVEKLQEMLQDNTDEGDTERTTYATFKCYCDKNEDEKTTSIADAKDTIAASTTELKKLRAKVGKKSLEKAKLEAELADVESAMKQADELRSKQNKHHTDDQAYLQSSIDSLEEAIEILAAVGGDQTEGSAADHDGKMAADATQAAKDLISSKSLMGIKQKVQKALSAASFLPSGDRKKVVSFMAQPTSQSSGSGEVVGILKNMLDTFKDNKADGIKAEERAVEAYDEFTELKGKQKSTLEGGISERETDIGTLSDSVGTEMTTLESAEEQLAEDEEFLADLREQCKEKTHQFEMRKQLHANEAAAIAQALGILNSDEAAATFGSVESKKDGAAPADFVQLETRSALVAVKRDLAQKLMAAALKHQNLKVARAAMSLKKGGPIGKVVEGIESDVKAIDKETERETKRDEWCKNETSTKTEEIEGTDGKEETIEALETDRDNLETDIDSLRTVVTDTQDDIASFRSSMKSETESRQADNKNYNEEMEGINAANEMITKAIKALNKFYKTLDKKTKKSLLTARAKVISAIHKQAKLHNGKDLPEDMPDAPEDAKDFSGQSDAGKQVIGLLKDIRTSNEAEALAETEAEETSQAEYEKFMIDTTADLKKALEQIADAEALRANKRKHLAETEDNLFATKREKVNIERYLESIKAECDDLKDNLETRNTARASEKEDLESAVTSLKDTPAYRSALVKEHQEELGKCAKKCYKMCDDAAVAAEKCFESGKDHPTDEEQAEGYAPCEACKRGVTVAAYCIGEGSGAPGCP